MQSYIKLDDFIGSSVSDATSALNYALSIGKPVWLADKTYDVSSTINLSENCMLFSDGGAKVRLLVDGQSPSGILFNLNGLTKFNLVGLTLSFSHVQAGSVQFQDLLTLNNCTGGVLENIRATNGRRNIVGLTGCTDILIKDSDLRGAGGNGIRLDASDNCEIRDTYIGDNENFGIYVFNGSSSNRFIRLRTRLNGLELIGIVAGCNKNYIQGCDARGTGDNGISISGDHNRAIGNHCEGNTYNGIGIWGNNNIVDGNVCLLNLMHGIGVHGVGNVVSDNTAIDNGQAGGAGAWAGISIRPYPDFGSTPLANDNIVANNFIDDTQLTPTQQYGIKLTTDGLTQPFGNRVSGNKVKRFGTAAYLVDSSGDNEIV